MENKQPNRKYAIKVTTEKRAFGGALQGKPLEMREIEVYNIYLGDTWINATRDLDEISELIENHMYPGRLRGMESNRFD